MQNPMFHPGAQRESRDKVAHLLRSVAQHVLVIVLGLFPILFVPVAYAPFGYSKVMFVLVGVVAALIFFALSVLREGEMRIGAPAALYAFWGLVLVYGISAMFSGDLKDALIGDAFGVHTFAFLALMAATVSATMIFQGSKVAIVRLYGLLIASGIVLALFHIARVVFGPEALTFGTFIGNVATPLGSWNGLALFFGLLILIALVAIEQLPLTAIGKAVLGVSSVLALVMLMIVNYFAVWVVLTVVSLVVLIYSLTRKHYRTTEPLLEDETDHSFISSIFATIVFVVSVLFILGGSSIGAAISNYTGVSYVEVRPSFTATFDIAREVYNNSPILGTGPNKFVDAWRLHKDPAINDTIFWNSTFDAGSGFIPTAFITTGIVGAALWLVFFALLLAHGFRMLVRTTHTDRFWNFIGTSSFVASVYLWGMAVIYTPPAAVLILAAVTTGIFLTSYSTLVPRQAMTLSVAGNRVFGIALVGMTVLIIFGSVGTLYVTGQHYSALYSFNKAFATATENDTIDTIEDRIVAAYDRSSSDVFAREIAQYRLAQTEALLTVPEPTTEQQQLFQTAVAEGVNAAQVATELDPQEPLNWQVLGQFYSALAVAGVEGAADRAHEAYERARALDPHNPMLTLLAAQLASRTNDIEGARSLAEEAVDMKRNYTEALLFLTQIDILNNDVEGAIARTESIISIEPSNPARYYQLGVLESSAGDTARAIAAFERAVELDPQYANARYLLALAYAGQGRNEDALTQLRAVAESNPENADIKTMIETLERGESLPSNLIAGTAGSGETLEDGTEITSESIEETSLVSPVNVVPEGNATSTSRAE